MSAYRFRIKAYGVDSFGQVKPQSLPEMQIHGRFHADSDQEAMALLRKEVFSQGLHDKDCTLSLARAPITILA